MSELCWTWMLEFESGGQTPIDNPVSSLLVPEDEYYRTTIAWWECGDE